MSRKDYNKYDEERAERKLPVFLRERLKSPQDIKNLAAALGCTTAAIGQYRAGKSYPQPGNLVKIALYYNVSLDYLIGLSEVSSPDASIQQICEYTGLTERAVRALHFMSEASTVEQRRSLSLVNKVLSDNDLAKVIDTGNRDSMLETIFSVLDQYITADDVERALDFERLFANGENPTKQIADSTADFLKRFITVRSSEDLSEMISVSELYMEYKFTQIRQMLDSMRPRKKGDNNGIG